MAKRKQRGAKYSSCQPVESGSGKSGLWRGMYRCLGGPMGTPMAPGGRYRAPGTCLGLLGLRNNLYANFRKVLLDSISVERG